VFNLLVSSLLSVAIPGDGKNRHVNTWFWIHVRLCGNKVCEKKNVWLFCGLDDEVVGYLSSHFSKVKRAHGQYLLLHLNMAVADEVLSISRHATKPSSLLKKGNLHRKG